MPALHTQTSTKPRRPDLWRHVVEGARARDGPLLVRVDGQPEIGELDAGGGDQDVLRLDVAVHHALGVHVVQRQQRRPQDLKCRSNNALLHALRR